MNLAAPLHAVRRRLIEPEPPQAAIEVRALSVSGLRLARDGARTALGAAAAFALPEGTLRLSLHEPNLVQPEDFRRALELVCDRCGLQPGARVALVLPDPVARVAFVPAAEARARSRSEMEEQLRFRLRKSLPFEAREAQLAFSATPARPGQPAQVLVVAVFRPVLQGYEDAVRALKLEPGLVELAGLSLLRALPPAAPDTDELLVNWDHGYVSLALLRGGEPVLFRTLAGELAGQPAEVAREVSATVLYYQERLGGAGLGRAWLRSAALPPAEAALLLGESLRQSPVPVDAWGGLRGAPAAAEAQAFAAAAATLLGGAA